MGKNFFDHLKSKVSREPDRLSDQMFWSKFDQEFGQPKKVWHWGFPWKTLATVSALLLLASGALVLQRSQRDEKSMKTELAFLVQLREREELLEDMELLESFETLDLTEEEWEELTS